jgi:hypothetical protein
MHRKHREIHSSLTSKGFSEKAEGDHIFLVYLDADGKKTGIHTKLSHAAKGDDIGNSLLGRMAGQVRLSKKEFIELVDCPMSKEGYAAKVREDDA